MAKLVPGQDPTKAIDELYSRGRTFPRGRSPLDIYGRATQTKLPAYRNDGNGLELSPRTNDLQAPQDPQDQQAPGYRNEPSVKSWLRGGADAPHFDHSKKRR